MFSEKKRKITLIPLADLHTGGTTALHPNKKKVNGVYKLLSEIGGWNYMDYPNFYPSALQVEIWKHYEACLDWAAEKRKDSRLVMVVAGDAIEGENHNTTQVVTRDVAEMMNAHEELIRYTQERLGWKAGDSLYYVFGTDAHTRNSENLIGERLGAYQYPNGHYCSNFLELYLNGRKFWIYHQGVSAGIYPTRGEMLTRQLKRIYYTCKMEGIIPPDFVITAHTHDAIYSVYAQDWVEMRGVILPSWQEKTRFALDKMPLSLNKIGLQIIQVSADGVILPVEKPMLFTSPLSDVVSIGS